MSEVTDDTTSAAARLTIAHRELLRLRLETDGEDVDALTREEVLRQIDQSSVPGLRAVFKSVIRRHEQA